MLHLAVTTPIMITDTISRATARRVYNRLGTGLDNTDRYESEAKARALALLQAASGHHILHIGVGTGNEHAHLAAAVPQGVVVGMDLSRGMLELTRQKSATLLVEGDATILPFATATFDRLFSAYMLDLLPAADIPMVLQECRRVLRPGGRVVLLSLTEGTTLASRLFVAVWKARFRLNPESLGGCRPLELAAIVREAGFVVAQREVVVQQGFPSELLVATVPF